MKRSFVEGTTALCTEQSGQYRGLTHLSKRGNARLRYACWMAGAVAVRMQQNTFRRKFEDYVRSDPLNKDRRRKAYTAVAAKMARVVYAVATTGIDYRRFPEATRPGGRIPSPRAVEASSTTSQIMRGSSAWIATLYEALAGRTRCLDPV